MRVSGRFKMLIENIYSLREGTAVSGYIDNGIVRIGDSLTLVGMLGDFSVRVVAIEKFQASLEQAEQSTLEPVGITLTGVEPDDVRSRDLLVSNVEPAKPA
jgi:elongation factor Tu